MQVAFVKTARKLEWRATLQKNNRASSTLVRTISNTGARPEQSKKPNTRMDALCRKRERKRASSSETNEILQRENQEEREREREREKAGSTKDENAVVRTVKASAVGNASPGPEDTLSRPTPPRTLFNSEHENERHRQRRQRLFAQLSPRRGLM